MDEIENAVLVLLMRDSIGYEIDADTLTLTGGDRALVYQARSPAR